MLRDKNRVHGIENMNVYRQHMSFIDNSYILYIHTSDIHTLAKLCSGNKKMNRSSRVMRPSTSLYAIYSSSIYRYIMVKKTAYYQLRAVE